MPSIVVVTRNPAIGMSLTSAGYEVVDVRPQQVNHWDGLPNEVGVVVLDSGSPEQAAEHLITLLERGVTAPMVCVTSADPGWDELAASAPGIRLMPLPLTIPRLMEGIDAAFAEAHQQAETARAAAEHAARAAADAEAAEQARLEAEERERLLALERERQAAEAAEAGRRAAEQAERRAAEAAERERLAAEQAERREAEAAERERLAAEQAERRDAERREAAERQAAERREAAEREAAERERLDRQEAARVERRAEPDEPAARESAEPARAAVALAQLHTLDAEAEADAALGDLQTALARDSVIRELEEQAASVAPPAEPYVEAAVPVVSFPPLPAAAEELTDAPAPPAAAAAPAARSGPAVIGTVPAPALRREPVSPPPSLRRPRPEPEPEPEQPAARTGKPSFRRPSRPLPEDEGPARLRRRRVDAPRRAEEDRRIEQPPADSGALVRRLLAIADSLYSVPETATVIVGDAIDRTGATAGAILVPDHEVWRVAGGIGLRPLEFRYEIDAEHWLVTDIAHPRKGMIVEDSDIAREKLHGAPLASWPHLLAAPVPEVEAILILAREGKQPFDETALERLDRLAVEAIPLLQSAFDVRELARRLADFRDLRQ